MCSLFRCDEVFWIINKHWHVRFPFIFVVWIGGVPAWRYLFDGFNDWDTDEGEFISCGSATLTWSVNWVSLMEMWRFRCTQWRLNVEFGWVEGVNAKFAYSFWGSLSSTVDWCVIGYHSVIACTGIILLNGNGLLVNPCSIKDKFVYHGGICGNLSFPGSQMIFSKGVVLLGNVVSDFGPIDFQK